MKKQLLAEATYWFYRRGDERVGGRRLMRGTGDVDTAEILPGIEVKRGLFAPSSFRHHPPSIPSPHPSYSATILRVSVIAMQNVITHAIAKSLQTTLVDKCRSRLVGLLSFTILHSRLPVLAFVH
jgi:hypothetical protein